MATYASAAGDTRGFYNIAALAPALDGFFVMAYDMNNRSTPSATAPLVGGGFNDTEALQQFTRWCRRPRSSSACRTTATTGRPPTGPVTAQATGAEPRSADGVDRRSGHPTYWDPSTETPWTSYQVGTQWHETYFDDPTSLALKAQLANSFHIAGLGIWALGMDGNDPAMMAALLGNAPAAKDYRRPDPRSTVPPGTGFTTTGAWNVRHRRPDAGDAAASRGTAQFVGTMSASPPTSPALACLQTGPPLSVVDLLHAAPGVDVAVARQPADCAQAMFTFFHRHRRRPPRRRPPTTTTTTTTTMPTHDDDHHRLDTDVRHPSTTGKTGRPAWRPGSAGSAVVPAGRG